jgi:hypothetical protein
MNSKKQKKEIQEIEKKVSEVCDNSDSIVDEITGISYPKNNTEKPIKNQEISITLSFGTQCPSFKKQLLVQGYKLPDSYINMVDEMRYYLHFLKESKIIKEKDLIKFFKRLNKKICKKILDSELKDGQTAILKKIIFEK